MSFIVAAFVMILVAAACVAVPLWRARIKQPLSTEVANRAVHAARVEELERDVATGRLAPEDYAAARRDLDKELEANLRDSQQTHKRAVELHGNRLLAGTIAVLLTVTAALLYWRLGNWRAGVEGVQQASVVSVEQMVAQLAHRLETTDQNDLDGWVTLGHAYLLMGRYTDAANAYAHARTLSNDSNSEIMASYGEAIALADPNDFMNKAMPAFEKALQLDPRNPQALWYGGLGALEQGNKSLAVFRWRALLAQDPPPEYRAIIEKSIAAVGGNTAPTATSTDTGLKTSGEIRVRVTLDARLRNRTSPDETVFVFAEPTGQSNSPPLAVRRFQVRDLPLEITLSDTDSMIPGHSISRLSRAKIVARISKDGTPVAHAGDLLGQANWQAGRSSAVSVLIDKTVR